MLEPWLNLCFLAILFDRYLHPRAKGIQHFRIMLSLILHKFRTDVVLFSYDEIPELFMKIATQTYLKHLLQIMLSIIDLPLAHKLYPPRLCQVELMSKEEGSIRPVDGFSGVLGAVHLQHGLIGVLKQRGVNSLGEWINCVVLFGCTGLYPLHGGLL